MSETLEAAVRAMRETAQCEDCRVSIFRDDESIALHEAPYCDLCAARLVEAVTPILAEKVLMMLYVFGALHPGRYPTTERFDARAFAEALTRAVLAPEEEAPDA